MTKTVKQIFFPKIQMAGTKEEPKVKRVAVYARVSTTLEEQQTSLIGQKDYYTQLINSRIDYTLAGIYADDGISGTSWKHRGGFKKMMEDAQTARRTLCPSGMSQACALRTEVLPGTRTAARSRPPERRRAWLWQTVAVSQEALPAASSLVREMQGTRTAHPGYGRGPYPPPPW